MADKPKDDGEQPRDRFGKRARDKIKRTIAPEEDPGARLRRKAILSAIVIGTGAVALWSSIGRPECRADNPERPADCQSSRRSSGGGGGGSSRSSSSSSSSSSSASQPVSHVTRGGFGGTGHSFFGGGG